MSDSNYDKLREARWRRKLTPDEAEALRVWLAGHPETQADWQAEEALNKILDRLPDAPVATNFTARVLQAVAAADAAADREANTRPAWNWRVLIPRAAFATTGVLAVAAGVGLFLHHEQAAARQMAQSVASVSEVASAPAPELLEDFEPIRQLNTTPPPDRELLALFK